MIVMSAGPTTVSREKLNYMIKNSTNTDIDKNYITIHRETEALISKLVNTNAKSFVMLGEAILGLEAACSSLIEEGDRVLVIHNGFFGYGFKYFIEMCGGIPVMLEMDYTKGLNKDILDGYLKKDSDFKFATLVHCETPSGIMNPIDEICPLLQDYGVLSIVDAVSSIGGEFIDFDKFKIDVLIGGSQKCLSVPSGLTLITISETAESIVLNRKTPIKSYYCNFKNHLEKSGSREFPYTMNDSLIYGLNISLKNILDTDYVSIHKEFGERVRNAFIKSGLKLYPKSHFSNTVTTVLLPDNITDVEIVDRMVQKGVFISPGVGHLEGKTIRIGHMGDNLDENMIIETLKALDEVFLEKNIVLECSLTESFMKYNVFF